jgi:hypothetical protein
MSEPKYTPAPWTMKQGRNKSLWVMAPDETCVAEIGGHFEGHHEANARLIAAAPDLLAACEELLASVRRIAALNGGGYMRDDSARCERAQAAIDRAKS